MRLSQPYLRAILPKPILARLYKRRFFSTTSWRNLQFGVFSSFDQARQYAARFGVIPRFRLDHERWLQENTGLRAHDYPMMFWLKMILRENTRIVDVGGSVGVSYYTYKPIIQFASSVGWRVCELDEVVEIGRRIAGERGERALTFTNSLTEIDGASVLFSAGALQYIERSLAEILSDLKEAPSYLLINRLPLTRGTPSFITLQNGGAGIQAYRIENEGDFIAGLARLGYRIIDRWKCPENTASIPLHPERSLDSFDGFFMTRESVANQSERP